MQRALQWQSIALLPVSIGDICKRDECSPLRTVCAAVQSQDSTRKLPQVETEDLQNLHIYHIYIHLYSL
jgi:hypothetical protein